MCHYATAQVCLGGHSITGNIDDKPNTILSARRISAILKKLPKVAATDIHDVIVEIAAETAKRVLWPGG